LRPTKHLSNFKSLLKLCSAFSNSQNVFRVSYLNKTEAIYDKSSSLFALIFPKHFCYSSLFINFAAQKVLTEEKK